MKRILFLFLLCATFAASFAGVRFFEKFEKKSLVLAQKELAQKEKGQRLTLLSPAPFALKNLPFTIVIVGYNNGAGVAKTLASVFSQNYENYRVVYIDDASDDGSYDLVRDLIYESDHLGQVTLVRNEQKLGPLANLFRAVQGCPNEEIIVILDEEDWLAHEWVLQRLNAYYADPDLWITYGQYRDYPTYQLGLCREWKEGNFRHQPFLASHLKTFYASLFKKVREADFIFGGKFLPACAELAYMIPLLEMAKDHAQFISEVLYINNRQTTHREEREVAMRCEKFICSLDPYPPIEGPLCGN